MIFRKNTVRAAKLLTAALVAGTALAGCARIRDVQGYIVDNELVAAISPGVDNRESVERTLGRPTFVSQWDDDVWYYVSRNVEQLAFMPSEPTAQQVLTIRFDAEGNVSTVDRQRGLEQVVQLDPADETTPVYGRDSSLFEDIFGNIGRVSSMPGGATGPRP